MSKTTKSLTDDQLAELSWEMKPYPVKFKFRAEFDLMPSWLPPVLQDWLEQGWTCDITVTRVKGCYGAKTVVPPSAIAGTH